MNRDHRKLVIIGGKGNGTVLLSTVEDIIADRGNWEVLGFLNDSHAKGDTFEGYPVLGKPEDAATLNKEDCYFYYGLLSAKTSYPQAQRLETLGVPTTKFATLVHPNARISTNVSLGHGVVVMPFTDLGRNAKIGNHVFIHANCYIARDTNIHDYSYFAPGATLGAEATMENGAYLGTRSAVIERVTVGAWSVVGMGAVVLHDVKPFEVVAGNPARRITTVEPSSWKE